MILLTKNQQENLKIWVDQIIKDLNIELIDINLTTQDKQKILRIILDKQNGLTTEDCAFVSRKLSLILDVEDLFPFEYTLEVSSPGIFRELKTQDEFKKFHKYRIKAHLKQVVNGQTKLVGILDDFDETTITMNINGQLVLVQQDDLKKIHLFPEI